MSDYAYANPTYDFRFYREIPMTNENSIGRDAYHNVIIAGKDNQVSIVIYQHGGGTESLYAPSEPLPDDIGPNPYKGLAAFHEEDADRFFGREELIKKLREEYGKRHEDTSALHFLAILGPSGCGKSSLARAGLIPELAKNPLPAMKQARVAVLVPGNKPMEALAIVLARIATNDPTPAGKTKEFLDTLNKTDKQEKHDWLRFAAHMLPESANIPLVIVIDQFEEIYTQCEDEEQQNLFVDNLLHVASDRSKPVSVLITLRSDFLSQTQRHAGLSNAISASNELVPAMKPEDLHRAIAEPAGNAGHPLDDATVDLLIEQAREHEGVLPLLEFALEQIWNGMASGVEPSATIKKIGGVGGALAYKAKEIYNRLDDKEKRIAKRAFLRLVRLGEGTNDTRRRVPLGEMVSHKEKPETVKNIIRKFAEPGSRLITLSADAEKTETAEITHEALFDHWGDLKQWLDKKRREDERVERRLTEAVNITGIRTESRRAVSGVLLIWIF